MVWNTQGVLATVFSSIFFFFFFFLMFWPRPTVCRVLVPRPGLNPCTPCGGRQSLHYWTARKSPGSCLFKFNLR